MAAISAQYARADSGAPACLARSSGSASCGSWGLPNQIVTKKGASALATSRRNATACSVMTSEPSPSCEATRPFTERSGSRSKKFGAAAQVP